METTVEQLIKERSYASLTGEELQLVSELCETEEEFLSMKQFFRELEGIAASDKTIVHPEVKQSLDTIFSAKFPGIHANWSAPEKPAAPPAPIVPIHQRTWVRVAAVALLILGTVPFWNLLRTREAPKENTMQTAKVETPQQIQSQTSENTSETQRYGNATITGEAVSTPPPAVHAEDKVFVAADEAPTEAGYLKRSEVSAEPVMAAVSVPSASYSFSAADVDMLKDDEFAAKTEKAEFFNDGRMADLHPNGFAGNGMNALSLAEQPDDLLDLLSPAF